MKVKKITDGLGFGNPESTIHVTADDAEILAIIDEAVYSPSLLVPVDSDDDGCGDGRPVAEGQVRSVRPKVFGGGLVMAVATRIGRGEAGDDPAALFHQTLELLVAKGINFGGHTDDHATTPNCGCGAIDKFPAILEASDEHWRAIRNAITLSGFNISGLGDVLQYFGQAARRFKAMPYSGLTVSKEIVEAGKVVKQLTGEHVEKAIILNAVPDHTVNQAFIREQAAGKADVFTVDLWRIQQLAEALYDNPGDQQRAILGQVVYTLATAAVLTRGNLPLYLVSQ